MFVTFLCLCVYEVCVVVGLLISSSCDVHNSLTPEMLGEGGDMEEFKHGLILLCWLICSTGFMVVLIQRSLLLHA